MTSSEHPSDRNDPYVTPLHRVRDRTPVIALTISILVIAGHAIAQTPDPQPPGQVSDPARPALNPFPAEQDWSFLSHPALHPDFFDPAKYIRLGDGPQRYPSFGLEYRTEYEYYDNWMFCAGPQDHNGYVMSRVMQHFDLHAGSDFRLFSELQFDYVADRAGGPRPGVDEDPGDFHQGLIEIGPHVSRELGSSLRLGRQKVVLGSGRLFDNNEGPNVKLSFDGVRWITQTSHLRWDVFALKPVEDIHGFFDDAPNPQQTTWGNYLTLPTPILSRGMADLYYIALATKEASYNSLDRVRFHPRLMLRADIYSGDGNPAGNTLGTFNSLFPRGAYFTPKAIPFLGPQNLVDLHPMMQFQLRRNITGEVSWDWYWRESVHDGVSAFGSGILMDSAGSSRARNLGDQGDIEIRWSPAPHFIAAFNLAGFQPSGFFDHAVNNRAPLWRTPV